MINWIAEMMASFRNRADRAGEQSPASKVPEDKREAVTWFIYNFMDLMTDEQMAQRLDVPVEYIQSIQEYNGWRRK